MSIFTDFWAWLQKEFKHITQDLDKVAITVTQQIKTAAESNVVGFLAKTIDQLRNTGVAEEILGIIKLASAKALAIELAIQLPTGDVTSTDFLAWEQKVCDAIGVNKDRSVIWTRVAATVIRDVQAFTQNGQAVTFAEAVTLAEDAYQAAIGR